MFGRWNRPAVAPTRSLVLAMAVTLALAMAASACASSGTGGNEDGGAPDSDAPDGDGADPDDADPENDSDSDGADGGNDSDSDDADRDGSDSDDADRDDADSGEPEAEAVAVHGMVTAAGGGEPLAGAVVSSGADDALTGADGRFTIEATPGAELTIVRPAWSPVTVTLPDDLSTGDTASDAGTDDAPTLTVALEPFTARGLRVAGEVATDPERWAELLDLTEVTTVNTLVFDTKDETDRVLYRTGVAFADEIGAVEPLYDPAELLAEARERGLYAVTRIVTFEDRLWAETTPEAQLALAWVDPTDRTNWDYPLDLAVEACEIGFDEIQFDYVRFPAGRSAERARDQGRVPETTDERAAVIGDFLAEARSRLGPMGCGVSAAIFGIVMSSPGDEGIGQTVEAVSASVDAVSPMLYPSHYGPGWIGFDDPNDHPGPVIAHALDGGGPRVATNTLMRPWLQAFYYNGDQIRAQIDEVEQRGGGWILWNASGRYRPEWLPPAG